MPLKRKLARWTKSVARHYGWEIRRSASCVGEMSAFLRQIKRAGLAPTNILDVGANKAEWSGMARVVFPNARFTLVEPQIELVSYLKTFCNEPKGDRWILAGAGPQAGEMVLNVWSSHLAGSSLIALADPTAAQEQRRVPIVTIDSLFEAPEQIPMLVKLDIQGFELEALKGASTLFGRTECFVMEVGLYATTPDRPVFADIVAFMAERGYKVYDVPGYLRRPLDGALGEIDLAFVLKGGCLDKHQNWC